MKYRLAKEIMYECRAHYIKVTDDSHAHQGHRGTDRTTDSHFSICVSSDLFVGKSLVLRHKMVYAICQPFFTEGMHALALETLTPEEWSQKYG